MPKLTLVSAHAATTMVARGAAALAHSASRVASLPAPFTPGSVQAPPLLGLLLGCGLIRRRDPRGNCVSSPKVLRNIFQSSALYKSLSSTTAIVWPCPEIWRL